MTAIGFVGVVVGWIVFTLSDGGSKLEDFGGYVFCAGAGLVCGGVAIWLWKVMP